MTEPTHPVFDNLDDARVAEARLRGSMPSREHEQTAQMLCMLLRAEMFEHPSDELKREYQTIRAIRKEYYEDAPPISDERRREILDELRRRYGKA